MTTSWTSFNGRARNDWCFVCGYLAGYCEHNPAETRLAEMNYAWEDYDDAQDVCMSGFPESFRNVHNAWRERERDLRLEAEEREVQIEASWMSLDWEYVDLLEWWRENHHWIDDQLVEEEDVLEFLGYDTTE